MTSWRPGYRVGEYELVRSLGAGGMGEVFLAKHLRLGVERALKTLLAPTDPDALARFQREAEAQARLDHPHVARIHDLGQAAGRLYIALDHLPGGDLAERLRRGPLPSDEAVDLVQKLAGGLAHAHAHGVLHRDLKPANVMFDEAGAPKLVDFGLAKVADAGSLTETGSVLGSPQYMAPEQALGTPTDERTDVYGLGAVLYHVLTGEPPFSGGTVLALLGKVASDPPRAPRAIDPDLPGWLEAVCLRALAKAPDDRFASVEALAKALRGGEGLGARRGWGWVVAGAVGIAAAALALRTPSTTSAPAGHAAPTPAATPSADAASTPTAPTAPAAITPHQVSFPLADATWVDIAVIGSSRVVAWSDDGHLWTYDLATQRTFNEPAWRARRRPYEPKRLPDGNLVGRTHALGLQLFTARARRETRPWKDVHKFTVCPDGDLIVASHTIVRRVRLRDGGKRLELGQGSTLLSIRPRHEGRAQEVAALAISSDQRLLAVGVHPNSPDQYARLTLLELPSRRVLLPLTRRTPVDWLAFAPDGSGDLLIAKDSKLDRLTAESGYTQSIPIGVEHVRGMALRLHSSGRVAETFTPNGSLLTVARHHPEIRRWKLDGSAAHSEIRWPNTTGFSCLTLAPNGAMILIRRHTVGERHHFFADVTHLQLLKPRWQRIR